MAKHRICYVKNGPSYCACGYDPHRYGATTFYQGVTMVAAIPHPTPPVPLPPGFTPDLFRATWPILDPDRTQKELIEEAQHTLPVLIAEAGAQLVGPVTWTSHSTTPDLDEYVLVATAPAIPYTP